MRCRGLNLCLFRFEESRRSQPSANSKNMAFPKSTNYRKRETFPSKFSWEKSMSASEVHQCECPTCQQNMPHPDQAQHRRINLLLSRLDEQQRRWYVAMESGRVGPGGDECLSQITGVDPKTIQRGRQELESSLTERPRERIRLPGGGRWRAEKKTPP
jgi:hypothetical protein